MGTASARAAGSTRNRRATRRRARRFMSPVLARRRRRGRLAAVVERLGGDVFFVVLKGVEQSLRLLFRFLARVHLIRCPGNGVALFLSIACAGRLLLGATLRRLPLALALLVLALLTLLLPAAL